MNIPARFDEGLRDPRKALCEMCDELKLQLKVPGAHKALHAATFELATLATLYKDMIHAFSVHSNSKSAQQRSAASGTYKRRADAIQLNLRYREKWAADDAKEAAKVVAAAARKAKRSATKSAATA